MPSDVRGPLVCDALFRPGCSAAILARFWEIPSLRAMPRVVQQPLPPAAFSNSLTFAYVCAHGVWGCLGLKRSGFWSFRGQFSTSSGGFGPLAGRPCAVERVALAAGDSLDFFYPSPRTARLPTAARREFHDLRGLLNSLPGFRATGLVFCCLAPSPPPLCCLQPLQNALGGARRMQRSRARRLKTADREIRGATRDGQLEFADIVLRVRPVRTLHFPLKHFGGHCLRAGEKAAAKHSKANAPGVWLRLDEA